MFGDNLYLLPENAPDLKGIKVLRPGLHVGSFKKKRFEPAHALALWLKTAKCMQNYAADSKEIDDYLTGNVTPTTERGWCLVTVDGYTLGWGKGDGKQLKNHYPKGLRRMR